LVLGVCTLGLLAAAPPGPVLGDHSAEQRTFEQRQQLERRAAALNDAAMQHYDQGRIAEAVPLLEEALRIRQQLYPKGDNPKGHPALAEVLNNLGLLRQAQREYVLARSLYQQAVDTYQAFYPQGHLGLANSLDNLGILLRVRGEYDRALPFCQKALAMRRALYSREESSPRRAALAASLNNVGLLLWLQGDYGRALPFFQQSLDLYQALCPKENANLAACLANLGSLLMEQGDYSRALPFFQRSLDLYQVLYPKEKYPQGNAHLAACLNNLGLLHKRQGEYGLALRFYQQALDMIRTLYPQGHPDLAAGLDNLGILLRVQGDYDRALSFYQRGLDLRQALYPKEKFPQGHPNLALSLYNLGFLLKTQGEYNRALALYQDALAMLEALYPKERYPQGHPHLALLLKNMGAVFLAQGDYARGLPFYQRALEMDQGLASLFADAASEAEALNYLAHLPQTRDGFLSLRPDRLPDATADDLYAPLWRGKAVLFRLAERRRQALLAARDPRARAHWDELQAARRQLARLLLTPAGGRGVTPKRLEEANARKEQLERRLAEILPTFDPQPKGAAGHTDLRDGLPKGSAFIDLYRYVRFAQDPEVRGEKGWRRTDCYTAFVLAPGRVIQRVELGRAAPLEEALSDWRRDIANGKESPAAGALRRQVWEPMAKHLTAGTRTVYLAPDAALARLPWAALPGSRPGGVLLEDYTLAVVPHGPFLLERLRRNSRPAKEAGLLALGGATYDDAPKAIPASWDERPVPRAAARAQGGKWQELPGTLTELNQVRAAAGDRRCCTLQGAEASTARVLVELPQARWAHLATHGFFADAALRSALQVDEKLFQWESRDRATPGARNPLVLSGLVLAGANRRAPKDPEALLHHDDGILTAEGIAGLPLDGLELAVLSACDSGLGEAAGGEGIFGLQRAFHLAGTRDVVASLWKVDDQAAAALMTLFYHQMWHDGREPLAALREAQLSLYLHPERIPGLARGLKLDEVAALPKAKAARAQGRAPAKQWAAFVFSGPGQPAREP
jgi:tetratricopeptide (TPR) repeat protein/CHAT domain-containing protein